MVFGLPPVQKNHQHWTNDKNQRNSLKNPKKPTVQKPPGWLGWHWNLGPWTAISQSFLSAKKNTKKQCNHQILSMSSTFILIISLSPHFLVAWKNTWSTLIVNWWLRLWCLCWLCHDCWSNFFMDHLIHGTTWTRGIRGILGPTDLFTTSFPHGDQTWSWRITMFSKHDFTEHSIAICFCNISLCLMTPKGVFAILFD